MGESEINNLLEAPLQVVNVGLEVFAEELAQQGVEVLHVEWSPPAGGDPELAELLSKLGTRSKGGAMERIEQANRQALDRMLGGDPVLVDVVPASDAIPSLVERRILHAGPAIEWDQMCGPLRGAVIGIAVFEG